jgi:hypothetical protein
MATIITVTAGGTTVAGSAAGSMEFNVKDRRDVEIAAVVRYFIGDNEQISLAKNC